MKKSEFLRVNKIEPMEKLRRNIESNYQKREEQEKKDSNEDFHSLFVKEREKLEEEEKNKFVNTALKKVEEKKMEEDLESMIEEEKQQETIEKLETLRSIRRFK